MSEEKCEGCGIPLGREMPEDSSEDEMLCDKCYEELWAEPRGKNHNQE